MPRRDAAYLASKLPPKDQILRGGVSAPVDIRWDTWGIPHLRASNAGDLWYGLGYVTAQERFWRLEYCRRQARGQLASILGRDALASDQSFLTIGLGAHVDDLARRVPPYELGVLTPYTAGVNRWIDEATSTGRLPVELDWLGVRPARWTVADCLACWKGRWWAFTGRLDNVAVGELARRTLPPHLHDLFMSTELGEETIVPETGSSARGAPAALGGADTGEGSNNWAVAGSHTTTGFPVLCSDPHTPMGQPSQWLEVHVSLADGSFDAAGMTYAGWPTIYMGRNRRVAWGFTNHVASTRDLYVEQVDPARPDHYRESDSWQPFAVERHTIDVRGEASVDFEVRRSTRGPVISAFLPDIGGPAQTITLRWTGVEVGSGLTAMHALNRARSVDEAIGAMRGWPSTVVNGLVADVDGNIGYHVAGFVPRRRKAARHYRDATDPGDAWQGYLPFDELPHAVNPARGWLASANQPPWRHDPPNFTYLRGAAWADGGRMRRIAQRLQAGGAAGKGKMTPEQIAAIQADVFSVRAAELVPHLLRRLKSGQVGIGDRNTCSIFEDVLAGWDYQFTLDTPAPAIWVAFWERWLRRVAAVRFPERQVNLAATQAGAIARLALLGDPAAMDWFGEHDVDAAVAETAHAAVGWLHETLGPAPANWRWGDAHTITWEHALATQGPTELRADAAALFNVGPFPTSGGPVVRAAGYSTTHPFHVTSGSTYRLVADLSPAGSMVTTSNTGQSGHPSSPHYADQARLWLGDEYHPCAMDNYQTEATTRIEP